MATLHDTVCIFDLDGTLVDSAPDLTAALNRALRKAGLEEMDAAEVRPLVGEGARALLTMGYGAQGRAFPKGKDGDCLVAEYVEDYASRISEHSFVFPGAEDAMDALAAEGATLAVCTNKVERLAEPLLRDLGLWDRFELVIGADTLAERKPSALPLRHIMEKTGRPRGVMVGDTATDFLAAQAAGIVCYIGRFGYGAGDARLEGTRMFDSYAELPALVLDREKRA